MIKRKGIISIHGDSAWQEELIGSVDKLPDGDYEYLILDKNRNRALPHLKYLFGVVLKTISENLPGNPPTDALYRWFEDAYAPKHRCIIGGKEFEYSDLKNENSATMDEVMSRIVRHAEEQWHIRIPTRDDLMQPEARELYADAYTEMWKNVISKTM